MVLRIWIWSVILTAVVCLWPVEYQATRLGFASGVAVTWAGALVLCWWRKSIRIALIIAGLLPALAVSLPGRAVDPDLLAADYCRALRWFRGVRYVWGGEGFLGIDCSGLVRKGLVGGSFVTGSEQATGGRFAPRSTSGGTMLPPRHCGTVTGDGLRNCFGGGAWRRPIIRSSNRGTWR